MEVVGHRPRSGRHRPDCCEQAACCKATGTSPVHDQHVANALEFGPSDWGFWQQVASDPDAPALTSAVQEVMAEAFPGRAIVPVPCRPLIWQNGSLHCITMQLPEGVLG